MNHKRICFTMVELMVVISVILILISILMPALKVAKESAVKIQCANKIKQIGAQTLMYCDDFKGSFPAEGAAYKTPISGIGVHWVNYINYYYFNDFKFHTPQSPSSNFICPTDKIPYNYQGIVNSYGFNAYIMSGRPERTDMRLQDLTQPSLTYMITDSNWSSRWAFGYSAPVYIRLCHNKTTSMFHGDGHIAYVKEQPSTKIQWSMK